MGAAGSSGTNAIDLTGIGGTGGGGSHIGVHIGGTLNVVFNGTASSNIKLKQLGLKVTWLASENNPNVKTDDEYKSVQLSSLITSY